MLSKSGSPVEEVIDLLSGDEVDGVDGSGDGNLDPTGPDDISSGVSNKSTDVLVVLADHDNAEGVCPSTSLNELKKLSATPFELNGEVDRALPLEKLKTEKQTPLDEAKKLSATVFELHGAAVPWYGALILGKVKIEKRQLIVALGLSRHPEASVDRE